MASIFESIIFTEMILPFLLVFVLVFAILQKSKILGEGKAQIDALVSLVIGLILIVFETPRNLIVNLMPWLAVGLVVILVFMLLYGFVGGDLKEGKPWMKIVFGILAGIFVIGLVIYYGGVWSIIKEWFSDSSSIWSNVILIVIIGGVLALAIATGNKKGEKKKDE